MGTCGPMFDYVGFQPYPGTIESDQPPSSVAYFET